jgi:hypothetical protein
MMGQIIDVGLLCPGAAATSYQATIDCMCKGACAGACGDNLCAGKVFQPPCGMCMPVSCKSEVDACHAN